MTEPLSKVDSAVQGLSSSPPKERKASRMSSSTAEPTPGEMYANNIRLEVAVETQKTGWKINTSSNSLDDKSILTKPLVTPPVSKIDLKFPLRDDKPVTIRKRSGVTIKDAIDAIYKEYRKRADDELTEPYLLGFEWPPENEESWEKEMSQLKVKDEEERKTARAQQWGTLLVHFTSQKETSNVGGGKKKKKAAE